MKKILFLSLTLCLTLIFTDAFALERDSHGRIKRSESAKNAFKYSHPCPANGHQAGSCPGYVIDHIVALACGGADSPENMQWQTVAEGKAKDAWERDDCQTSSKTAAENDAPSYSPSVHNDSENTSQTIYTGPRGGRYV